MSNEMKKGFIISFEGGDGCGKSTQIELLAKYLKNNNLQYEMGREPGGTEVAEALRKIIKSEAMKGVGPRAEVLLFESARASLVYQRIIPAMRQDKIFILDRFTDSTVAYQSYGNGQNLNSIQYLNEYATYGVTPDLTIYLAIEPDFAFKRKGKKDNDVFEQREKEYHNRVKKGYDEIAEKEPTRILTIDATLPPQKIAELVQAKFYQLYQYKRNENEKYRPLEK